MCAKISWRYHMHRGLNLSPTGKRRYRPNYKGASRRVDVFYQYQVKCNDCGHVGWSRHIDVARKWKAAFETA